MRRIGIMLLLVSVLISQRTTSLAQASTRLGVKAGLNIATTNENNSSAVIGFVGGGFLVYSFTNMVAIQPEVLFTMKGRKADEAVPNLGTLHSDIRLNYVELPILAKITLATEGTVKPSLFAGPFFSLFLENTKGTDLGLTIGGGLDFNWEQIVVVTDLRYSLGLKNALNITTFVTDPAGNTVYQNSRDIKNRVVSLMVGISF